MKTYKILKGCHYSNFFPLIYKIKDYNIFKASFSFDNSCEYIINEQSCVNKLFGFSFGLFGVHTNSIRFGWTYNNLLNNIYIWSYFYKNGKLYKNKIFACNLNEEHEYCIELNKINDNQYTFRLFIDNNVYEFQEIYSDRKYLLTLGPYFGGNTKAPHTIKIFKN